MNILLCNDDGFDSKGIRLLKEKLSKYGNVYIIAPETAMSAKSCAVTIGQGMNFIKHLDKIYSFSGTPADCVSFALSTYPIKFDLVVSGCNNGLNVSYDTMYSGTIGACLEALIQGKPAIAFSAPSDDLSLVEKYFDDVMDFINENELISQHEFFLNVNFPTSKDAKSIRFSRMFMRNDKHFFLKKDDGLYYAGREVNEECDDKETDVYQVNHSIISVTPMKGTYFGGHCFRKIVNNVKTKKKTLGHES